MLSNVCQAQTAGPVAHVKMLAKLPLNCICQTIRSSRQLIHLFIQLCRCQIVEYHCWLETCVTDIAQETTPLLFKLLNSNSFWLSLLGLCEGKSQCQFRAQAARRDCSRWSNLRKTSQRLCTLPCHHGRPLGQPCTNSKRSWSSTVLSKSDAQECTRRNVEPHVRAVDFRVSLSEAVC